MKWLDNRECSIDFYFYLIASAVLFLFFFVITAYRWNEVPTELKMSLIGVLIFIVFIGFIYSWKWYLADYHTPKKLRWDEKGIEMINVFDKRVKIPWKYVLTIKHYRFKSKGKWHENYYVRYNIPELFIFHKNRFWVTLEIGEKLKEAWDKKRMEMNWGIKDSEQKP